MNYGASQSFQREDYDQAQLASNPGRNQDTQTRTNSGRHTDIYGAESQWATKLNDNFYRSNSFTSNHANDGQEKPIIALSAFQEKSGVLPEALPKDNKDSSSHSSSEKIMTSSEESAMNTSDFGKKTEEGVNVNIDNTSESSSTTTKKALTFVSEPDNKITSIYKKVSNHLS